MGGRIGLGGEMAAHHSEEAFRAHHGARAAHTFGEIVGRGRIGTGNGEAMGFNGGRKVRGRGDDARLAGVDFWVWIWVGRGEERERSEDCGG